MASSQHRCVFVGNIPYDVTEDQLKEVCREVGPVVHFRLVTDKETGRPKGYGFCEYIDEETALSARRNLQGYEINGRQLRVDFAENDKSSDRSRDPGRGGPGLAPNPDMQKQQGGPSAHGEPSHQHQPIGHQIALTAATAMAGVLISPSNVNGVQNHSALVNDSLTLHLAKLSRSQFNDILSELKALAIRDKESARQLLLARPELSRALFQAEIMLDLVTPQVMQMLNIKQNPAQPPKPPLTDSPSLSGLPPVSRAAQKPISGPIQASVVQPQVPIPQQHNTFRPVSLSNNTQVRAHNSLLSSSTPNKKQTPSLQDPRKAVTAAVLPPVAVSPLPSTSEPTFQVGSRIAREGLSINPPSDQYRASKLMRLEDGSKLAQVGPGPASVKPSPIAEGQYFEKQQTPQSQLPADVESVLLQQVMTLTPEQISSLPPEQQQQVLQLQQMLR